LVGKAYLGVAMGKVDVIHSIFESYELVKANYKEVIVPLVILLLLSGAGSLGGSSFSGLSDRSGSGSYGSSGFGESLSSPITNALSGGSLAALSGILLLIIAIAAIVLLVLMVVETAIWFYVFEFFHALLRKKKITENWKSRIKRHSVKSFVLLIFWGILIVAIFAVPTIMLIGSLSTIGTSADFVGFLLGALVPFAVATLVLMLLGFLLTPLWIYYAMDGRGFFESLSKSVSLVSSNLVHFIVYFLIHLVLAISIGVVGIISALCCLAWLVIPVLSVAFTLIMSVALLKIKMDMEKK